MTLNPDSHPNNASTLSEEGSRDAKRSAGNKTREEIETGQHRLADEADALSNAIDAAASNLDDDDREGLARYARELSSQLSNAAKQLESRNLDELANDAKRLARKNPALFMLGSISVGFGLSRFFKASADHKHQNYDINDRNSDRAQADDIWRGMQAQAEEREKWETKGTSTAPQNGNGRDLL